MPGVLAENLKINRFVMDPIVDQILFRRFSKLKKVKRLICANANKRRTQGFVMVPIKGCKTIA